MEPLAFRGYRLDRATRRLFAPDGAPVPLSGRAYDVLEVLVDARDRVVGRDELLARAWPGRVVEENNLNQAIAVLRRSVGTHADDHDFILTVPGRGYRFVAPIAEPGPPPAPAAGPAAQAPAGKQVPMRRFGLLALVLLLSLSVAGSGSVAHAPLRAVPALAILPFHPIGNAAADPLLSLGMADTLATRLGRAANLRVLPLDTVRRRLAGRPMDPLAAGRDLDADYVAAGSTQVLASRIRINARLFAVADGRPLWAETVDVAPDAAFAAQDRIARGMSAALALRYPGAAAYSSPCDGADGEAYRAYLRGAYLRVRPGREDTLPKALAAFDEAIARDPRCARAWAGKAFVYRIMAVAGDMDPAIAFPEARSAVERALQLDPGSTQALASRGIVEFFYDWNWEAAEATLRHAIALDPDQAETQFALAHLLHNTGRGEEALAYARRAAALDPLSPVMNTIVASFYAGAGREAEARRLLQAALDLDPDFWVALFWRANLETGAGDLQAAIRDMTRAVASCARCSHAVAGLAWLDARAGRRAEAERLLQEMQVRDAAGYIPATRLALAHAGLGERGRALDMLERAHAERDFYLTFLLVDPRLRELQDEPRYRALLARMRLPATREAPPASAVAMQAAPIMAK